MASSRSFPKFPAEFGLIYCKQNNVRFPVLYRVHAKVTLEHLIKEGLQDEDDIRPGEHIYFETGHISQYLGDISVTAVTHIPEWESEYSIVIRHHESIESANFYLDGHLDSRIYDESDANACVHMTDDFIFTSIHIPTSPLWPGALVFYLTKLPHSQFKDEYEDWACILGPDGQQLDSKKFGY